MQNTPPSERRLSGDRARSFANATTKQEAAEIPPLRQPSPPPGKRHQKKEQAADREEMSGDIGSDGGFMHPERVSRRRRKVLVERCV
jgi:hypothetical protein